MRRHLACLIAVTLAAPGAWAQASPELETLCVEEQAEPRPRREAPGGRMQGLRVLRPAALLFASFDQDGDYAVSDEELRDGLAHAYPQINANGDDRTTLLEYAAWSERALGARDARPGRIAVDPDLDGHISEAEFLAAFRGQALQYGLAEDAPITLAVLVRPISPDDMGGMRGPGQGPGARGRRGGGGPGGGRMPGERPRVDGDVAGVEVES